MINYTHLRPNVIYDWSKRVIKFKIMKKLFLLIMLPNILLSQEIAVTESGKKVFLKKDGTYEFIVNSESSSHQKGKVKGVVTYFFNNNYGNKPDIGSQVFIRETTDNDSLKLLISNFNMAKTCRTLVNLKRADEAEGFAEKTLKELNINSESDFENLSKKVYSHLLKVRINKDTKTLTVDANGSFEVDLDIGNYEIIVVSKNRNSINSAEIMGKVLNKNIEIKDGSIVNCGFEFDKY